MDERERAERLAEAIDRMLLEGGPTEATDEGTRSFLLLAEDLRRAMPPVAANPAFEASLRANLLARRRPSPWRRLCSFLRVRP